MKQKITVLVIEDSSDDFALLREILESSQEVEAKIFREDRLEGAISAASNSGIDVAIIDLSLPDSFGLDTFVAFHEQYPLMPTIIMTGSKDHDMAIEAGQSQTLVTTTGIHVARRIGEALARAYKGDLSYQYAAAEKRIRVYWQRQ